MGKKVLRGPFHINLLAVQIAWSFKKFYGQYAIAAEYVRCSLREIEIIKFSDISCSGSEPKPSTLIPIPEGVTHLHKTGGSRFTQSLYVDTTNSHSHKQGSDDNYTTLHMAPRGEGGR